MNAIKSEKEFWVNTRISSVDITTKYKKYPYRLDFTCKLTKLDI